MKTFKHFCFYALSNLLPIITFIFLPAILLTGDTSVIDSLYAFLERQLYK
jgi:hypothetical protein